MDPARYKAVGDSHVASLFPQLYAAELLENSGYGLCIVGDLACRVYGQENIIFTDVNFAICDDQLTSAATCLLSHDFKNVPFEHECAAGIRVKHTKLGDNIGIILSPASVWHLDLTSVHYPASITMLPNTSCPFPRFPVYLNAVIDTLVSTLLSSDAPPNPATKNIKWTYSAMVELCPTDLEERLPPENQFFIKYYPKMWAHSDRRAICRLRQDIQSGAMDVATATDRLPQKALKFAELRSKLPRPSYWMAPTPLRTPVLISPRAFCETLLKTIRQLALIPDAPHFIVVGGGAMSLVGDGRATADIDVLVEASDRDTLIAHLRLKHYLVMVNNAPAIQLDPSIDPIPLDVLVALPGDIHYSDVNHLTASYNSTTVLPWGARAKDRRRLRPKNSNKLSQHISSPWYDGSDRFRQIEILRWSQVA
ncbi:hypothetical protein EMPG_10034 [Blastomyces silverae]|uniref:Uncharacterized protein n=1 Tax=Blastomyces silverae TaxID=2060906 RepID=A0A0H1B5A4_9EURO|nr:hypothetical protein EMPG_10034 [Blastomyces silverae]